MLDIHHLKNLHCIERKLSTQSMAINVCVVDILSRPTLGLFFKMFSPPLLQAEVMEWKDRSTRNATPQVAKRDVIQSPFRAAPNSRLAA